MANNRGWLQLIVTALALVAVVALIWYLRRASTAPTAAPSSAPMQVAPATSSGAPDQATPHAAPGRRVRLPQTAVPGVERIDIEQRAQLIKQIQDKLAEKKRAEDQAAAATAAAQPAPASAPVFGSLDKEYIRDRIKEIVPLVRECYEMSPEDKPLPEVKLVTKFVIEGADQLGGVVTSSEILNQEAEQQYPELAQCVRETMYALRMKAPEGGGTVTVSYPFKFSPGPNSQATPPGSP